MTNRIRPVGDRVVVSPQTEGKRDDQGNKVTASGIVLVEAPPANGKKEQPRIGEVLAVGPGKLLPNGETAPPPVTVGEVILFDKFGATGFREDGEAFIVVDSGAILGVFENPE